MVCSFLPLNTFFSQSLPNTRTTDFGRPGDDSFGDYGDQVPFTTAAAVAESTPWAPLEGKQPQVPLLGACLCRNILTGFTNKGGRVAGRVARGGTAHHALQEDRYN